MTAKIMIFAYSFIIGIAVGFARPVSHDYLGLFLTILITTGILWAVCYFLKKNGVFSSSTPMVVFMILFAASLGLYRFTQDFSSPDVRLGIARVEGNRTSFSTDEELEGLHRLKIMKQSQTEKPVTVTLKGTLNEMPSQTPSVIIMPSDPVGMEYDVAQPLAALEEVQATTVGRAAVGVYKKSNHIENFADGEEVEMIGYVSSDPYLYSGDALKPDEITPAHEKVELTFTPEVLRYTARPQFEYKINGGNVLIEITSAHNMYEDLATSGSYGYRLKVKGKIAPFDAPYNPYGWDQKWWRKGQNIYGSMRHNPRGGSRLAIDILKNEDGENFKGNWLVEFSLAVRDKMIIVIKQTMPYPESAFLGGVTLGMRYGLHRTTLKGLPYRLRDAFQWAGTGHVLAVSGLHVTIITGLFWGIFSLMKIPPRIYAPIIVLFLIMFTIITGARPSTQRAAIMNSLVVLTYVYLGGSLRSSLLFGISVAALLILIFQPLLIVDPSFTLSFGAVLSLGLLTSPVNKILAKLRGWTFIWAIAMGCLTTLIGILHWALIVSPAFYLPYFLIIMPITFFIAHKLNALMPGFRYSFTDLPTAVSGFISAQFAIQLGMMIPLSSFYFQQWPFAGAYANFIAIPLIGVIVSLGMIAGIIGMIPWFGIYIALVLNASNYLLCYFFLWLNEMCVRLFPYPYTEAPSFFTLVMYFLVMAVFIWHQFFIRKGKELIIESKISPFAKTKLFVVCALVIALIVSWVYSVVKPKEELTITALSVSGDSILIEIPDGRNILINADGGSWDMGFFCKKGAREFDYMIFSTININALSRGSLEALDNSWVKNLILPFDITKFDNDTDYEKFLDILGDPGLKNKQWTAEVEDMYVWLYKVPQKFNYYGRTKSMYEIYGARKGGLFNDWAGWTIDAYEGKHNMVLIDEEIKVEGEKIPLRVEIFRPGEFTRDLLRSASLMVKVSYGDFSFLYGGQITAEEAANLPAQAKSDVFITPYYGDNGAASDEKLLNIISPEKAVISPDLPWFFTLTPSIQKNYTILSNRLGKENVYVTHRTQDGAVIINSDGKGYTLRTMAQINELSGVAMATEEIDVRDHGF